ncbi:hypothetical protein [Xanthovirga aplysinae]|uniref:hypothetical protein n=1 Tax=Xanthovirga aplysinae TaxID=2529853 RepID=UPI0012BD52FC|nr:hypothetical protein [Xanthovirga aplysinae]MTI30705.1 hypothetical protein [Xanthovirga aplysinae]
MKNSVINKKVIKKVATALKELNEKVVYVGGAVVSMYIDDPAADYVRPTKDVDISLEIVSIFELEQIRQDLNRRGFYQSSEDDVICRFRYDDVKVDVMSTKKIGWAPANPWFAPGFVNKEAVEVDDIKIYILSLPYYLATKFVAFNSRGGSDPRMSHDFEDITYILDNQTKLVEIISLAPSDVLKFLRGEFNAILKSDMLQEAIQANLYYETQAQRFDGIIQKLRRILDKF